MFVKQIFLYLIFFFFSLFSFLQVCFLKKKKKYFFGKIKGVKKNRKKKNYILSNMKKKWCSFNALKLNHFGGCVT